jgi:hypothetical protein
MPAASQVPLTPSAALTPKPSASATHAQPPFSPTLLQT